MRFSVNCLLIEYFPREMDIATCSGNLLLASFHDGNPPLVWHASFVSIFTLGPRSTMLHHPFIILMPSQYATRLMIVKGAFQSISLAIYGETVSESPSEPAPYEPKPLPAVDPRPLSKAVDPASMLDPTRLANQLLSLIPDSPPLALVIRLMFCLKPSNEDWDLPDFPYLHADLDAESEVFDLETALSCTAKPVRDDISYDALSAFAMKVAESIGSKVRVHLILCACCAGFMILPLSQSSNQAYLVAKLLCISAPQHPDMARTLLVRN